MRALAILPALQKLVHLILVTVRRMRSLQGPTLSSSLGGLHLKLGGHELDSEIWLRCLASTTLASAL